MTFLFIFKFALFPVSKSHFIWRNPFAGSLITILVKARRLCLDPARFALSSVNKQLLGEAFGNNQGRGRCDKLTHTEALIQLWIS